MGAWFLTSSSRMDKNLLNLESVSKVLLFKKVRSRFLKSFKRTSAARLEKKHVCNN